MKRVIFAAVFLFQLFSSATAQTRSILALTGNWRSGEGNNQSAGLEVVDSTQIFLVYGNEKLRVASYKADFSKTPAWFDFTVKDNGQEISLKSLLLFVNEELIQWQVFEGETRPVIFAADRGEMVFLKKKK